MPRIKKPKMYICAKAKSGACTPMSCKHGVPHERMLSCDETTCGTLDGFMECVEVTCQG